MKIDNKFLKWLYANKDDLTIYQQEINNIITKGQNDYLLNHLKSIITYIITTLKINEYKKHIIYYLINSIDNDKYYNTLSNVSYHLKELLNKFESDILQLKNIDYKSNNTNKIIINLKISPYLNRKQISNRIKYLKELYNYYKKEKKQIKTYISIGNDIIKTESKKKSKINGIIIQITEFIVILHIMKQMLSYTHNYEQYKLYISQYAIENEKMKKLKEEKEKYRPNGEKYNETLVHFTNLVNESKK